MLSVCLIKGTLALALRKLTVVCVNAKCVCLGIFAFLWDVMSGNAGVFVSQFVEFEFVSPAVNV